MLTWDAIARFTPLLSHPIHLHPRCPTKGRHVKSSYRMYILDLSHIKTFWYCCSFLVHCIAGRRKYNYVGSLWLLELFIFKIWISWKKKNFFFQVWKGMPPLLHLCHSPPHYCAQIYATKVKTNRLGVTKSVWLVVWKVKGPLRREGGIVLGQRALCGNRFGHSAATLCPKCSKHNSHVHLRVSLSYLVVWFMYSMDHVIW